MFDFVTRLRTVVAVDSFWHSFSDFIMAFCTLAGVCAVLPMPRSTALHADTQELLIKSYAKGDAATNAMELSQRLSAEENALFQVPCFVIHCLTAPTINLLHGKPTCIESSAGLQKLVLQRTFCDAQAWCAGFTGCGSRSRAVAQLGAAVVATAASETQDGGSGGSRNKATMRSCISTTRAASEDWWCWLAEIPAGWELCHIVSRMS